MIKYAVFITMWVIVQSFFVAILFTMHLSIHYLFITDSSKTDRIQPLEPSYEKNVKPVFKKRCSQCHNEMQMPDKNWQDYDIAVKFKDQIKERAVIKKDMPLGINPSAMPDSERGLIGRWVELGTPR